ncbi:pilus assembly FimT family protein [Sporanaerobacter acetigenes]|nr:prepilin-type N-terminal cleavage/methylation domain-containing protein [Sporanaerobacter acetigenes]
MEKLAKKKDILFLCRIISKTKLEMMKMRSRGTTLIEIVITLAILSIVLAIAAPRDEFLINTKERKELLEFKNDIIFARNMAIIDVRRYSVEIYPKENYYTIYKYDKERSMIKKKSMESGLKLIDTTFANSPNPNHGSICFTPTGAPSKAGTVNMKSRKGKKIELTVEVATGKVNIYIDGDEVK